MNEKKIRELAYYMLGKGLKEKNKDKAEEYMSIFRYLKKHSGIQIIDLGNIVELACNKIKYKNVGGRKIPDVNSFVAVKENFDDWNNKVLYSFDIEFINKKNGHKEVICFCTNDLDSSYLYNEGYNVVQINPFFQNFTWISDSFTFKDPEMAGNREFRFKGLLSENTADPICNDKEFSLFSNDSKENISDIIEYKPQGTMEGTGVYPEYFVNLDPSAYMSYLLRKYPDIYAMIENPSLDLDDEQYDDYYGY